MKPDWDKLGDSFASSEGVQIVDVDCTADGQQTCQKMGVKGYPTIKYFTDKTGKKGADYQGGRDFASLKKFTEDKLNVLQCDVNTLSNCAPNEKSFIEKNQEKTPEEIQEQIDAKNAELKEIKTERSAAEAELKTKEKAWKKKETLNKKALGILKQLIKNKK
eukprot:TRINITY_DN9460_c0_g1_i1.p1 TRINITY_DN9460_c0_g1~~TRINITY_DN9460_c0_g1_i1.p1  ORF type:complete len:162 (-),score=47.04 TRINITY_DN9460_c0_g1_i1:198-683(-)